MGVYEIDPLCDLRWPEFLQRNPRASVFHTHDWLEALKRTYGYEPVAYTTSAPGAELVNAWLFCRVRSWLTGRRLVSLPFSDHCDPLVDKPEHLQELSRSLRRERDERRWNYIEYRPLTAEPVMDGFRSSETFCFHKLDLQPDLDELFHGLHKDSTQRKIRRAEREGLTYEEGRSEALLNEFYDLLILTRRRHRVPPQPRSWFCNLIKCLGEQLKIRVAFKQGVPVASILTLRFKNTLVYKYGCSDSQFWSLGGMHSLLWRAIQDGKENGVEEFDLGRSDLNNDGLILFKDRWGAKRWKLSYLRCPVRRSRSVLDSQTTPIAKRVFAYMPERLLSTAGRLLYRHLG